MRSQKQTNRAPRPFKNNQSAGKWTGGSGSSGFIPGPKVVPRVKKPEGIPPPAPDSDTPKP